VWPAGSRTSRVPLAARKTIGIETDHCPVWPVNKLRAHAVIQPGWSSGTFVCVSRPYALSRKSADANGPALVMPRAQGVQHAVSG
jgi:hypothetical protein